MVKEYLENYLGQLIEEKIDEEQRSVSVENEIRENAAFISLLEEKSDPNYESFTPREIKSSNKKKIEELKARQKALYFENEDQKAHIADLDAKIAELNSVIRVAREVEKPSDELINEASDNEILRRKLLETQEAERQRIARELHDSTVQSLTGLMYKAELLTKLMDMDPNRCKVELKGVSGHIKDIINDMRSLIYDLRPMSFDDIGVDTAIERDLSKLREQSQIPINYYVQGEGELPQVYGLTLLRIIHEACMNSIKHAKPTEINVRFRYLEDEIEVTVEDDGNGFNIDEMKVGDDITSGFGLPMMKERIFLLSGDMDIDSRPGEGTTVKITVPLRK